MTEPVKYIPILQDDLYLLVFLAGMPSKEEMAIAVTGRQGVVAWFIRSHRNATALQVLRELMPWAQDTAEGKGWIRMVAVHCPNCKDQFNVFMHSATALLARESGRGHKLPWPDHICPSCKADMQAVFYSAGLLDY